MSINVKLKSVLKLQWKQQLVENQVKKQVQTQHHLIIEKKIELNKDKQNGTFMIICKSDIIGNVYLPKLKFLIYEGNISNPIEKVYATLLFFNCVEN